MSILASTVGYGASFAARAYFGVTYLHEVQQGLEALFSKIASTRVGPTLGRFVGKQASYVLAFPCVNLAGEVVSFVVGSVISRVVGVALQRWRGAEEKGPSRTAWILGGVVAFVVKNTVAFHSVERVYGLIKRGFTRVTVIYLGEERTMVGPISSAVGIQAATWGAFPAASLVGDTVGLGVKKVTYRSTDFVIIRLSRPSEKPSGGEQSSVLAASSPDG